MVYIYDVYDGETGELVASGTTEECSKKLGITTGSFHTYKTISYHGRGKYHIESRLEDSGMSKLASEWDRLFGWFRQKKDSRTYPCDGCMSRALCEFTDTYCPRWAEWFRAAHEAAAATLKARGGGG